MLISGLFVSIAFFALGIIFILCLFFIGLQDVDRARYRNEKLKKSFERNKKYVEER